MSIEKIRNDLDKIKEYYKKARSKQLKKAYANLAYAVIVMSHKSEY